jgi:HK97 family phage portal protein
VEFFGYRIERAPVITSIRKSHVTSPVADNRGGWWPIREPFAGAFQRDIEWTPDTVLAHSAVFGCITLIASDIGKLRPKLVEQDANGIWKETQSAAFSPVLRKPNPYQNRIQFIEWWMNSKLIRGNTYALKERDSRGIVVRLYLLDPSRVQVLVAPDGSVFYKLGQDNLSGIQDVDTVVPASEMIHDRMNCLFHPLVGVSPIFASGMAAHMGLKIEGNSTSFFNNGSNPSGILTAPMTITAAKAEEFRLRWASTFGGTGSGGVAVLGDNMKFEPMRMTAVDSQLVEQLKWSAEVVCSTFHVPPFKLGIGTMPTYNNAELLNQIYYSDCLQSHIEQFELCMDEGLGLTEPKDGRLYGVELDLDALLRMDTATQIETLAKSVGAAIHTPNEARFKLDLSPQKGGDTPYLQQQNYSLAALDERDRNDPFEKPKPAPAPNIAPPPGGSDDDESDDDKALLALFQKAIAA